jgi:metallo-beta-lactamase family protein
VRARTDFLGLYSGHADGAELAAWVRERLPIAGQVLLVHGEQNAMNAMSSHLAPLLPKGAVLVPGLDEVFELISQAASRVESEAPARLPPESLGRIDWHNDLSRLLLDINVAESDERNRQKRIGRVRRALANEGTAV